MRKLMFYARLAIQNLRKNRLFYGPNLLACTLCAAMLYIIRFLSYSDMIPRMQGTEYVSFFLSMGTLVLALMVLSILVYANGFIMKRRQKELGLYNILGMEKRQVAHVLVLESFFMAVASVVLGCAVGVLFSKLALMGLMRLLTFPIPLGFSVSWRGMLETAEVIGLVFVLLILRNLWILHLSRPVDLLSSAHTGEAEPRSRRLMALIGALCLIAGYAIAVTVDSPVYAMALFFVAVFLVIIGTYCLFTAVSVVVLKALRRNKAFYYKPRHFTAVSGMLYRMKQNAKGMHNICILVTMLLVTISTTVCMYVGSEETLTKIYPDEITLYLRISEEDALNRDFTPLREGYRQAAESTGVSGETLTDRLQLDFAVAKTETGYTVSNDYNVTNTQIYDLDFMTLEDYNRLTGSSLTLEPGEVLCYNPYGMTFGDALVIDERSWPIRQVLDSYPVHSKIFAMSSVVKGGAFFVVADREALVDMLHFQQAAFDRSASDLTYGVALNPAQATDAELIAAYDAMSDVWGAEQSHGQVGCRAAERPSYYGMNGAFLFLGIFLGLVFLIATVLMIYYKQISEGYEDQQRFQILQKVGMSRSEVRGTIHTQVLMIFFLPLLVAAIHMGFAFPLIQQLLMLFSLNNLPLFLLCTLITFLVFAVVYTVVYIVTARKYYQIVRL